MKLIFQGQSVFTDLKCPVDTCQVTEDASQANSSDLVVFRDYYSDLGVTKHARQLYMIYMLESPYHTGNFPQKDVFNWTATYRYLTQN